MSLIPDKCIEYNDSRKQIIAEENSRVFRLINSSGFTIRKIKCDKCIKQNVGEKRCDFLISINQNGFKRVFFIELKGGNLSRAIQQINDTIDYLKEDFTGFRKEARIVGSADVPNLKNTPDYRRLAKKIYPGEIVRATNKILEEPI